MLSINSNPLAMQLANQLKNNTLALQQSANRIATGKRIVSAADDPAGMGILSTLKADARSYNAVQKNIGAGQSLLEVGSSALKAQQEVLQEMRDVATQAASGTLNTEQRDALKATFTELQSQLNNIVNDASLFGQNLVGTTAADVTLQVGKDAGQTKTISSVQSDAATLGIDAATINLDTAAGASTAMTAIDTAIGTVSTYESTLGSQLNGLNVQSRFLDNLSENLAKSISRIEDVDLGQETAKLQQLQAKEQLTIQMLGMVNQFPSYALGLLR